MTFVCSASPLSFMGFSAAITVIVFSRKKSVCCTAYGLQAKVRVDDNDDDSEGKDYELYSLQKNIKDRLVEKMNGKLVPFDKSFSRISLSFPVFFRKDGDEYDDDDEGAGIFGIKSVGKLPKAEAYTRTTSEVNFPFTVIPILSGSFSCEVIRQFVFFMTNHLKSLISSITHLTMYYFCRSYMYLS